MKPTTYRLKFAYGDPIKEITVDHDPDETGIDVEAEYDRWMEIGELSRGSFMPTTTEFKNFLWSELGLMTLENSSLTRE